MSHNILTSLLSTLNPTHIQYTHYSTYTYQSLNLIHMYTILTSLTHIIILYSLPLTLNFTHVQYYSTHMQQLYKNITL